MRDVWQPGAALRAISRRLCSPAEVVRTPVQWQHGLSGRDKSLTRHKRCTWHAWVMCWRSQAVPVTLSTLCTMVTDMLRFRPRQSCTSTTQAAGDETTPVARPRRVVSALPWSRAQKLACTSVSASPHGSSVEVNLLSRVSCGPFVEQTGLSQNLDYRLARVAHCRVVTVRLQSQKHCRSSLHAAAVTYGVGLSQAGGRRRCTGAHAGA